MIDPTLSRAARVSPGSCRDDRFPAARALHRVDGLTGASMLAAVLTHPGLVAGHGVHCLSPACHGYRTQNACITTGDS